MPTATSFSIALFFVLLGAVVICLVAFIDVRNQIRAKSLWVCFSTNSRIAISAVCQLATFFALASCGFEFLEFDLDLKGVNVWRFLCGVNVVGCCLSLATFCFRFKFLRRFKFLPTDESLRIMCWIKFLTFLFSLFASIDNKTASGLGKILFGALLSLQIFSLEISTICNPMSLHRMCSAMDLHNPRLILVSFACSHLFAISAFIFVAFSVGSGLSTVVTFTILVSMFLSFYSNNECVAYFSSLQCECETGRSLESKELTESFLPQVGFSLPQISICH